jgi:NADPH:quinone reductase-like Zn-dependent oxidoreductase
MARAVQFDHYGGLDVLQVVDVPDPVPGPGEALVRVKAASINPGEGKIREGALHSRFPATFPSGEGSDFAGVVEALGDGVTAVAVGDEVIGYSDNRNSQAELVVVAATQLTPRPPSVPWEVAGSLHVAGVTAWAAVRAVSLTDGDTVVVAGAAGGVGVFAVQLAALTGATVIGLAGESKHGWLRSHDVVPVLYGDGVEDRIRAAAPDGVDAFLDLVGGGYVELALALGVAPDRIDTIADFEAVSKHGVKGEGSAAGTGASTLAELAADVANGSLEVPIAATYPLDQVRDAYAELEQGHTLGKIVLLP